MRDPISGLNHTSCSQTAETRFHYISERLTTLSTFSLLIDFGDTCMLSPIVPDWVVLMFASVSS